MLKLVFQVIRWNTWQLVVYSDFVVGTKIDTRQLNDPQVSAAYKGQAQAEGGFRLLQALFFRLIAGCEKALRGLKA